MRKFMLTLIVAVLFSAASAIENPLVAMIPAFFGCAVIGVFFELRHDD